MKSQYNSTLPYVYKADRLEGFNVSIDSLNKYCSNLKLRKENIQSIEGLAIIKTLRPDSFKMLLVRYGIEKNSIQSFNYSLYVINKQNEIIGATIIYNRFLIKTPLDFLKINAKNEVEISQKIEYRIKFYEDKVSFE